MNIGNFGSFFEIFAGLNLAYISIEVIFNYAINKKILTTRNENFFRNQFADIVNSEIRMSQLSPTPTTITIGDVQEDIENILNHVKKFGVFPVGFQPAFLISALFCIFILVSYGFECTFLNINFSAIFVILINSIIFIKSFSGNYCDRFKNKLIWIPLVVIGLLVNILLIHYGFDICKYLPNICHSDFIMALISCIAGASSFIFYFIRVIFYNFTLIYLTKLISEKISNNRRFKIFDLSRKEYPESRQRNWRHYIKQYFRNIKNAYERLEQIKSEENDFENLALIDQFLRERLDQLNANRPTPI